MTVSINIHLPSGTDDNVDINIIPYNKPEKIEDKETASFLGLDPAVPIDKQLKLSPAEEKELLDLPESDVKDDTAYTAAERLMSDPTMEQNRKMREDTVQGSSNRIGFQ